VASENAGGATAQTMRLTSSTISEYEEVVAKAFGIRFVGCGLVHTLDSKGDQTGIAIVKEMWWAQIAGPWREGEVIVGVVHYSSYRQWGDVEPTAGIFMVPFKHGGNIVDFTPQQHVWFTDWQDPVKAALQSLNLMEVESEMVPGSAVGTEISIKIYTHNGDRFLHYRGGPIIDPSWQNLLKALLSTVTKCCRELANPAIEKHFKKGFNISEDHEILVQWFEKHSTS